jgi:hypothetical protein
LRRRDEGMLQGYSKFGLIKKSETRRHGMKESGKEGYGIEKQLGD